jgi:hypothetical protein
MATKGKRVLQSWDPQVHEDILLAVLDHIKPDAAGWSQVMETLRAQGHTFTEGALKYVSLP